MSVLAPEHWAAIALGPVVGSFLGVLVTRLPAGERIALARSRCPHCLTVLGARDLVPLVSWMASRGRCRHCGQYLGLFYPGMELAATAVALWAATAVEGWVLLPSCLLGWALLALAVIDQRHLVLPDPLTLPLIAGGLVAAAALPAPSLPDHAVGAVAGFVLFWAVARLYERVRGREGLGGGDAKLLAAAGAWVSWTGLPTVVLGAGVFGLAGALVRGAVQGGLSASEPMPFGPYLCLATWCTWLYGPIVFP